MIRLLTATLAIALASPAALAQSGGMTRGDTTEDSDTPERPQTRGENGGSAADTAEGLGIDTSACQEYLVPAHRDIVELRYIAEALPAGSLKREFAGRIDRMEEQTASALGSLCGVRNLDRTPPTTFESLDIASVAGTVGSVFGNDVQINEDGFVVQVIEAAIEAVGGTRRQRRQQEQLEARRLARDSATAVDNDGIAEIVAAIRAAPFSDDKVAALRAGTAGKKFTSAQVATLVEVMPFAEQRVPIALYLYDFTTDPVNFETEVGAVLPFASERSELRASLAAAAAE